MTDLASKKRCSDGFPEPGEEKMSDQYDHDQISIHDLMELGVTFADFGPSDTELPDAEDQPDESMDRLSPPLGAETTSTVVGLAEEALVNAGAPPLESHGPEYAVHNVRGTTADFEAPTVATEAVAGSLPETGDDFALEVLDCDDEDTQPALDDPLDQLWYLEVPEAEDKEVVHEVARTSVSSGERAMQLALEFLLDEDLYSERNLDLLADIIRERGWSGVQTQVRGFVLAGYEISQIHRMFQLTDVWMHCVESDTLASERWHGGKRLTWLEAAHLLDFLGYDAEFEQIADFLSSEQEVWHGLRRNSGHLATFKNYLFQYRLSSRTQVDDGVWQTNLDPGDMRSFDGTRNSLFVPSWWNEPLDDGACDVRQMFGAICDPARIAEWLSPDAEDMF